MTETTIEMQKQKKKKKKIKDVLLKLLFFWNGINSLTGKILNPKKMHASWHYIVTLTLWEIHYCHFLRIMKTLHATHSDSCDIFIRLSVQLGNLSSYIWESLSLVWHWTILLLFISITIFFIKNFMKERLEFRHLSVKYCKKHGKYSFYQVYYSVRRDLV